MLSPPLPDYPHITPDLSHPALVQRYETALRETVKTLRRRLGQVRLLYYAGRPPPDVTLTDLFPCSARQVAPHLFVSDATVQPYELSLQSNCMAAAPVVAEAAHFGLLLVERRCPLTPDEYQQLRQTAIQLARRLLEQLVEVENNGENSASLIIDKRGRRILVDNTVIGLRGKQLALFQLLYQHRGYVCSRSYLCRQLYRKDGIDCHKALTVLAHHLRRKLECHSQNPLWLETVQNQGYRLRILTKFL